MFIKQLFRLLVISTPTPPTPSVDAAAGCSVWVATSKFGNWSWLNPTKAGRLNVRVSEQREASVFEVLGLMWMLFHKHTTPAVVTVPAGQLETPQIAKLPQLS